jgi:acetylornithine deacetylase/succinyl-diaminopimelate desuccinylase-like protein
MELRIKGVKSPAWRPADETSRASRWFHFMEPRGGRRNYGTMMVRRIVATLLLILSAYPARAQKSTWPPRGGVSRTQTEAPARPAWVPPAQVAREVREYRVDNEDRIVRELTELLEIPNQTSDAENIQRNAEKLREMLEARGFETHLLPITGRGPLIFGKLTQWEARRTAIFYGHYDGAATDAAKWTSGKPFEPALWTGALEAGGTRIPFPPPGRIPAGENAEFQDDWRIYARSAADNKAPIVALLAAMDALRAQRIPLGVNLKVVLDSEAEAGSPDLERVVGLNKNLFGGDVLITIVGTENTSGPPVVLFGKKEQQETARAPKSSPVLRKAVEVVEGAAGDFAKQSPLEESGPVRVFGRLGLPVIGVPIVNFDSHRHEANENVRLGNLWRGIEVYAAILADLTW